MATTTMTATDDAPRVIVWRLSPEDGGDWHPYPWRFAVVYRGRRHDFAGVPNRCATRRQAAIRGWWRARWLAGGTYDSRYEACGPPISVGPMPRDGEEGE